MENLYRKNKSLFEQVLDKLKEFVKNLREYFAHVNPNTKVEAAALKENTENGMRYLEKIVDAFDKTAEAAVENYQQGATESAAESKAQYKTRGKYWRPALKGSEWKLLERRMAEEIGSRENFLDEATKWVYAEEKGVQVFALYGVGDGTEATPLYAVGGKKAAFLAADMREFVDGGYNYDKSTGTALSRIRGFLRTQGDGGGNIRKASRRGETGADDALYGGARKGDAGGAAGRGTEDQRGVKEKYSIRDSAGRELTEAQREYFKDSKVRDKDGKLLVMYRGGTGAETVLDRKKSKYSNLFGRGFYFTDDKSKASQYGSVRAFYLNIQEPLSPGQSTITKKQMRKFLEAVQVNEDEYDFWNYGESATVDSVLKSIYGKGDFEMLQDINATAIGDLVAAVELFNYVNGTNYDGIILPEEIVTFTSNQAKNIDNKTPTADPDIRYSLREEFSGEIDAWHKAGMPEGEQFTLGSTGPVLQGLGAIESDIYMEGDKIKTILREHPEMTLTEIKKIPQILEDPAMVLKSEGRGKRGENSRLICFGLTKAQNGQPVMTVMDLRPREHGFVVDDMQKVNSAYTKKNPMAFVQKSDVVYADEKRAIPLLRMTGLTISSQQLLQNGYIGSISYKGSSVNIQGVPAIPTFVWDFCFRGSFRLSDSFQLLCGISVFTPNFG